MAYIPPFAFSSAGPALQVLLPLTRGTHRAPWVAWKSHFRIEDGLTTSCQESLLRPSHPRGHGLSRESSAGSTSRGAGIAHPKEDVTETEADSHPEAPQRREGTVVTSRPGNVAWQFRGQQAGLRVDVGRK